MPCSLLQQEPWRALCWGRVWGWHVLLAVDTSVFFLSCSMARSKLARRVSVSAEWCLAWHRAHEHRQTLLREACGSRRDLGIILPCPCSFPLWRPSLEALGSKRKAVEPQEGPAISTLAPVWSKPDFQRSTEQEQPPLSAVPEHGSKSSAAASRFWNPWQEMMPSPSSPVFRPLWPVQAPAHTLAGTHCISALPAAEYCQKQSCFQGLRMEKGRHRQKEAKAKAVQSSYQIKVSGNKRGMRESTIIQLTGQASVNHHLGEVKISTVGAQRKPTWQTHLFKWWSESGWCFQTSPAKGAWGGERNSRSPEQWSTVTARGRGPRLRRRLSVFNGSLPRSPRARQLARGISECRWISNVRRAAVHI